MPMFTRRFATFLISGLALNVGSCSSGTTSPETSIQTWVRQASGPPARKDFEIRRANEARDSRTQQAVQTISRFEVEHRIADASAERLKELRDPNGRKDHRPLVTQGGRLQISTLFMAIADLIDESSQAHALDYRQLELIEQVASIGRREGFGVVVKVAQTEELSLAALYERPWLSVLTYAGPADIWAQDTGDIRTDHSVMVPARVGDPALIHGSILRDRLARLYPAATLTAPMALPELHRAIGQDYPLANFEVLGRVDRLGSRVSSASMAATGSPVQEAMTYLEGGNHLVGRDGPTTFAIVGRDSVAASRALMARDLDRQVSEQEVLEAIAHDLGVPPNELYPVEQPGEFHLDMSMMLLGPRVVLLNDAIEAARLEVEWMRADLEKMGALSAADEPLLSAHLDNIRQDAAARARMEDRTAADLEASGFTVHRVAGVFPHWLKKMNLMNMVLATSDQSEQYGVVFGADDRAEAYFAKKLLEEIPGRLQRIHFLSRSVSMPSGSGGIKCRVKPDGVVVP
jgi:hypothetical protein